MEVSSSSSALCTRGGCRLLPIDEEEVVVGLHGEDVGHVQQLGGEHARDEGLERHEANVGEAVSGVLRQEEVDLRLALVQDRPPHGHKVEDGEEEVAKTLHTATSRRYESTAALVALHEHRRGGAERPGDEREHGEDLIWLFELPYCIA